MPSLLLALSAAAFASCQDRGPAEEADTPGPAAKVARDRERGVTFRLQGDRLTVSLSPTTPQSTRQELVGKRLRLFCGRPDEYGPFGASARTTGRLAEPSGEVTVRLRRDISGDVGFCGVEGGSTEAFGFFPSEDEVRKQATAAFEQRQRAALRMARIDGRPEEEVKYRRVLGTIAPKCLESYVEIAVFTEQMTRRLEVEKRSPGGYNNLRTLQALNDSILPEHARRVEDCTDDFARSLRGELERRLKKERDKTDVGLPD